MEDDEDRARTSPEWRNRWLEITIVVVIAAIAMVIAVDSL